LYNVRVLARFHGGPHRLIPRFTIDTDAAKDAIILLGSSHLGRDPLR